MSILCNFIKILFLNHAVESLLFPYYDTWNRGGEFYHSVLPDEWSSVRDCPLRYLHLTKQNYYAPVAGQIAYEGEFPHMAAIGWTQKDTGVIEWNCGGSLITENFILTAGHCTNYKNKAPDVVRLGDLDLENDVDSKYAQQLTIAEIITHPNYSGKSRYHDLALLKLNASVTLHDTVCPACIWNNQTINFKTIEACGYGQIGLYEDKTPKLLKVSLSPIPTEECKSFYPPDRKLKDGLTDQQICAVDPEEKQDTCLGDSGGPLQIKLLGNDKMHPFVLGVTSFGNGFGLGTPGVYVRISEYIDWLESVTGEDFDPFKCVKRYDNYREFEPDIVSKYTENGVVRKIYNGVQAHFVTGSTGSLFEYNYIHDYIVEIGWLVVHKVEQENVNWLCTGTIIDEFFILTSASCILNEGSNPSRIRTSFAENMQIFTIEKIFTHPSFVLNHFENDIALLQLDKKLEFGADSLRPACLWYKDDLPIHHITNSGIELNLIGTGPNIFEEGSPMQNLYARSSRLSTSSCKDFYSSYDLQVSENQLCYGNSLYILPNYCTMSRGAPIERLYSATDYGFLPYQFGIQTFGNDCGFGYPLVSTRVSKYVDWIDSIIFGRLEPSKLLHGNSTLEFCNLHSTDKSVCKQILNCGPEFRKFRKPILQYSEGYIRPKFDSQDSFSHIAILLRDTKELGYGVLITDNHVLASYGFPDFEEADSVVLGSKSNPNERTTFTISDVKNIENSFLLFKLSEKVTFSQSIVPACLWLDRTGVPFDELRTVEISRDSTSSLDLVGLRPYQKSDCTAFLEENSKISEKITEKTSCAKQKILWYAKDEIDFCSLWNGVPIQSVRNEEEVAVPYLVGFESFRHRCGSNSTLYFNRVAFVIDSIIHHL